MRADLVAAHRALAQGIAASRRGTLEQQPAHLIDIMPTVIDGDRREVSDRVQRATRFSRWRASACGRRWTAVRSTGRNRSSGSTKATARCVRATGSRVRVSRRVGALRHDRRSRRAQQRRRPASRYRQALAADGTRGPSGPTSIHGPGRRGCRGATTHRAVAVRQGRRAGRAVRGTRRSVDVSRLSPSYSAHDIEQT